MYHKQDAPSDSPSKRLVVVGNGMVGHRFCELLAEADTEHRYEVIVFGEENRPAYDRVRMSEYFTAQDPQTLALTDAAWYAQQGITLRLGETVTAIHPKTRTLQTNRGHVETFDELVLATGSYPFVPPVFENGKKGLFVYRTIDDLDAIIDYATQCRTAAVIGGGLLGLEAAKAVRELGLETTVVEFAPRLMPRQLDEAGSALLLREMERQGVRVCLGANTQSILGNGSVKGLSFGEDHIDADLVVISAGIKPRDELGRNAGLALGGRGGICVNDFLETSAAGVYAIGECASHQGMVYGLVAPGYDMAETLVARLLGEERRFEGADLSTKLKLLGVEVASFGNPFAQIDDMETLHYSDPTEGVYKKLLLSADGKTVLGGILVGDARPYALLAHHAKTGEPITAAPAALLGIGAAADAQPSALPDSAQVCSCNNVTKAQLCAAIRDQELRTPGEVKTCTKAGTGCGGCMPLVNDLLTQTLAEAGITVKKTVCEHFPMSRQELFHGMKVKKIKTYGDDLAVLGQGGGCEICKPAVASILASLWNEHIGEQDTIQDTNDRFMANIQRKGSYSIVPRVPGGEITPQKLIVLGQIADEYDLYCKITGGQRIDLLGARVDQLPEIWEKLIAAGFESGHAYGKAVRTVKSCVGSTWCRFGVQDSTRFAIEIEERYKGIRAPHKIKFAVSGCIRECAEAQCKDVGLIATEKGWNLYVAGNGGAKPRHADLLVADVDKETAITYIDRFLMYYIHTADPLTRTSVWFEKLEGGMDQLREVILHDSLGICETLEADMARLVDSYHCEWKAVVDDPEKRARFRHFANTPRPDPTLDFVRERGQRRPADACTHGAAKTQALNGAPRSWFKAGRVQTFPKDGGMAIDYGNTQIAVYHHGATGKWYATQNNCPHMNDMVLARGILGEKDGVPKVACPLHKKQFSLETGQCLSGEDYALRTFEVKIEDGFVYLHLPKARILEAAMGDMPPAEAALPDSR